MISSHVCDASVPELVKTTHVIDKLLSGESTVLTRGGGEGRGAPGSWKGFFSERNELLRSLRVSK